MFTATYWKYVRALHGDIEVMRCRRIINITGHEAVIHRLKINEWRKAKKKRKKKSIFNSVFHIFNIFRIINNYNNALNFLFITTRFISLTWHRKYPRPFTRTLNTYVRTGQSERTLRTLYGCGSTGGTIESRGALAWEEGVGVMKKIRALEYAFTGFICCCSVIRLSVEWW